MHKSELCDDCRTVECIGCRGKFTLFYPLPKSAQYACKDCKKFLK